MNTLNSSKKRSSREAQLRREQFPENPHNLYHVPSKEKCEDPKHDETQAAARHPNRFYHAKYRRWICSACALSRRLIP